jgi:hypothetical protein
MPFGLEEGNKVEEPKFSQMNEQFWKSLTVWERMKTCYKEAKEIKNYSYEQIAILCCRFVQSLPR